MNKMMRISIALVFLLALIPVAASSHSEDTPLAVDLLAGQTEDIGDVLVWNDVDYLYVKYVTTDDWCLTETHLAVAGDLEEIPTTKKDNPM
jgi:hypothetical protein